MKRLLSAAAMLACLPLLAAVACGSFDDAATDGAESTAAAVRGPFSGLLWARKATRQMAIWSLDGRTYTGRHDLDFEVDGGVLLTGVDEQGDPLISSFFTMPWHFVNATSSTLFWKNVASQALISTTIDLDRGVEQEQSLSRPPLGSEFSFVGQVRYTPACGAGPCFQQTADLYYDPLSGVVARHDPSAGRIVNLSWQCKKSDGCSDEWKLLDTADFDRDGVSDVLWHNVRTGELSVWLLDGTTVRGKMALTCGVATGCPRNGRFVDAADVDRDGAADVLFYDEATGEVRVWTQHGDGVVKSADPLSRRCTASDGCSRNWTPLAYVRLDGPR